MLRTIKKAIELGWITKNPHLTDDALAAMFIAVFKDMTLQQAIDTFVPRDLL